MENTELTERSVAKALECRRLTEIFSSFKVSSKNRNTTEGTESTEYTEFYMSSKVKKTISFKTNKQFRGFCDIPCFFPSSAEPRFLAGWRGKGDFLIYIIQKKSWQKWYEVICFSNFVKNLNGLES